MGLIAKQPAGLAFVAYTEPHRGPGDAGYTSDKTHFCVCHPAPGKWRGPKAWYTHRHSAVQTPARGRPRPLAGGARHQITAVMCAHLSATSGITARTWDTSSSYACRVYPRRMRSSMYVDPLCAGMCSCLHTLGREAMTCRVEWGRHCRVGRGGRAVLKNGRGAWDLQARRPRWADCPAAHAGLSPGGQAGWKLSSKGQPGGQTGQLPC